MNEKELIEKRNDLQSKLILEQENGSTDKKRLKK